MATITTTWAIQWMKTSTQPINGFNEVVLDCPICTGIGSKLGLRLNPGVVERLLR